MRPDGNILPPLKYKFLGSSPFLDIGNTELKLFICENNISKSLVCSYFPGIVHRLILKHLLEYHFHYYIFYFHLLHNYNYLLMPFPAN